MAQSKNEESEADKKAAEELEAEAAKAAEEKAKAEKEAADKKAAEDQSKASKPSGGSANVKSNYESPLGLPNGVVINPGATAKVEGWEKVKDHHIVKAWLAAKVIEVEN